MKFLFKKVNIASLAFFRIVFGILGFADVLGSWIGKHWMEKAFNSENFQFKYFGFEWVKTLPDPWLSLVFILGMFAALGIAFGKWYRTSATVFALCFSYIFFLEKAYYLNHGYLTMLIAWWIIFMPLAKNYSMDALRKPALQQTMVDYWSLFLIKFMMGVVYCYGGIAKLNWDWLNGLPLKMWLKQRSDMPLLGYIWKQDVTAYIMSYGGLLLDLFVVFFLLNKKTRIWALGFVIFFHLNNLILFQIGIFPFLSTTLTLLFFEPEFPIHAWNWLERKIRFLKPVTRWWQKRFNSTVETTSVNHFSDTPRNRYVLTSAIVIFSLFMLVVPFRHHFFEDKVAWTEEGHRYSWRMMLRQKYSRGYFKVKNLVTNDSITVQPRKLLTKRQRRKLMTHPEMILQFAHHLRDKYEKEYGNEVAVFCEIRVNLNGRRYQQYIDPTVNLAKEEFNFFKHKEWIIPFEEVGWAESKK